MPRSNARKTRTQAMKATQCQPVISTRANIWQPPSASRRRLDFGGGLSRDWSAADVGPLPFMPPEHQRARDINTGIRPSDDADQERKREVVDRAAPKNVKRQGRNKHRPR